jgi:oligosaccharide repeat unit polymerase
MANLFLAIITIGFLFYRNIVKKQSWVAPSSVVIMLYFLSVLLSYPYMLFSGTEDILSMRFFISSIVFCVLLFLFLSPFLSFREDLINKIVLPNSRFLYVFSIIVCGVSLFSLIYFIPSSIIAIRTPDIQAARYALLEGDTLVSHSIFNTIAGTAASFYQIPIVLFFIYQILERHWLLKVMLLVSSFSYTFFVLSYYGRDGILFFILSFIGLFGFFKPFLTVVFRKKIWFFFIFLVIGGLVPFLILTFSRFGDQSFRAIISYMGQGFPNFCLMYNAKAPITYGNVFPLFRDLLGLPEVVDSSIQKDVLESSGTFTWVFGTFLKSFVLCFGVFGTFILGFIFQFIFKHTVSKKIIFSFANLLIYFLYFQIFFQGVFYYRQYDRVGNLLIIVSFLLYFVFNLKIKLGRKNIVICKITDN